MKIINIEVLIIGAGPSGCVAASYLHNNGVKIKVVEKNNFPRFVIGESLLPRCMDHFDEVGLLDCLKNQKFEVKSGARFLKNDIVCDFDFSQKHTLGRNWTWQVPRADFDKTLTDELIRKGVDVKFENEVIDIKFDSNGTSLTTIKESNGETYKIQAKYVIDSSGYGRVLPRLLDLDKPSSIPSHSSIFTHINDSSRPEGKEGTLITFDILDTDTWFWVIPFSNGNTSIGFVGKTNFIETFQNCPTKNLKAMLKHSKYFHNRFKNADFLFDPITIKNYSKSVKKLYGKGYVLTGNSSEFLDPIFSSGVTFATESGLKAAKLIAKELREEKVDWEKDYVDYIKSGVNVFATYVKEWYTGNLQTLFFHRPENPIIKKQICAVLAGYVWDQTNPFVKKHSNLVKNLAYLINLDSKKNNS